MKLTIVTATLPERIQWVTNLMQSIHDQRSAQTEHLIVCDGSAPALEGRTDSFGCRLVQLEDGPHRDFGVTAHQHGVENAQGEYVCFWDDDNAYRPHAVQTVVDATRTEADLVVVQVRHYGTDQSAHGIIIPPGDWKPPRFICGAVDTSCVIVRREFALQASWIDADRGKRGSDFRWLQRLSALEPNVVFLPVVIGVHS